MRHNYRACASEPGSCNYRARGLQLLKLRSLERVLHTRSRGKEKPTCCD